MNLARGEVRHLRIPRFRLRLQDLMFLVLVSALLLAAGVELSKSEPTMIQEMLMQLFVLGSLMLLVVIQVSVLLVMVARFSRGEIKTDPSVRSERERDLS